MGHLTSILTYSLLSPWIIPAVGAGDGCAVRRRVQGLAEGLGCFRLFLFGPRPGFPSSFFLFFLFYLSGWIPIKHAMAVVRISFRSLNPQTMEARINASIFPEGSVNIRVVESNSHSKSYSNRSCSYIILEARPEPQPQRPQARHSFRNPYNNPKREPIQTP